MSTRPFIFTLLFCLASLIIHGQTKYFEFSNPGSIALNDEKLDMLTSGYWRVFREETEIRGTSKVTPLNISMCYYPDGTFFYNGSTGTWKVREGRYIDHQLDKEVIDQLNFGGIFAVSELSDSTLTITKLLTTSHDMKRTQYLKASTVLTRNRQSKSGNPYSYPGTLSEATIDSLCNMDSVQLFNAGFTILPNNMIYIMATDTMHILRLNVTNNRHQSFPMNSMRGQSDK